MIKLGIAILIISALCISHSAEYFEAECEHGCGCESSHTCVCEPCSSFFVFLNADMHSFDGYTAFITFSESFYPVFSDQECINRIDHPPRFC